MSQHGWEVVDHEPRPPATVVATTLADASCLHGLLRSRVWLNSMGGYQTQHLCWGLHWLPS